jgi:hypothetical protein
MAKAYGDWISNPHWFHRSHCALPPTTEPSPATEYSAPASTPRDATTTCSKDRTIEWPAIEWVHTGRRIIGRLESISVRPIRSIWHSTETSSSTGHGTHSHRSSSIKSRHDKHLLSFLQFFEPLLNPAQVFSKEIGLFLKKPNFLFFGRRTPWCHRSTVPPGVPRPTSSVTIEMISPWPRSHSVWHSYHSFLQFMPAAFGNGMEISPSPSFSVSP